MDPVVTKSRFVDQTVTELVSLILAATDRQISNKVFSDPEIHSDLLISTDALNLHRVEWRCREEGRVFSERMQEQLKSAICNKREYDYEELDAALMATKNRPRLPFGWTAMDLASHRLESHPVRFLNPDIEGSRYARRILALALHLQSTQKDQPILLPIDQVRRVLKAKKVVVSGTIKRLVDLGLLEITKADYRTGSAREFRFKGVEGQDYIYEFNQG